MTITPSYSGCPAMSQIEQDIRALLQSAGYRRLRVETRLSPAWSSDELSPQARSALKKYGIAPPCAGCGAGAGQPACPRCGAEDTRPIAEFGSTACKALWQCNQCHENFDYFKPI